jgi:hypothetical protein
MSLDDWLSDAVDGFDECLRDNSYRKRYPEYLVDRITVVHRALKRLMIEVNDIEINRVRAGWKRLTEEEIDKRLASLEASMEETYKEKVEQRMAQLAQTMEMCRMEYDELKRRHREGPGCDN